MLRYYEESAARRNLCAVALCVPLPAPTPIPTPTRNPNSIPNSNPTRIRKPDPSPIALSLTLSRCVPLLGFVTTRAVKAGEELFATYGHTYWLQVPPI